MLLTVLTLFTAQANASTSKYKCFTGVPADESFRNCTVEQALSNDTPMFIVFFRGYLEGIMTTTFAYDRYTELTFEQRYKCHNASLQILNSIIIDKLKATDISFDDDYKFVLYDVYIARTAKCLAKELDSLPK